MEQKARLTFLGTGTSSGIPMIGCDCAVCRSADPRDKRLRAAALVEYGGLTILVDAGPDLRSNKKCNEVVKRLEENMRINYFEDKELINAQTMKYTPNGD